MCFCRATVPLLDPNVQASPGSEWGLCPWTWFFFNVFETV
jgi:hypothetical protein